MTPKQRLASIIRNKIPEIVDRSRTISPNPLAVATTSHDEPPGLEFTPEVREKYFCIYCDELYPKDHGSECPKCKGLDLSGRKHGGDGRKLRWGDGSTLLAEPSRPDREEEQ